MLPSLKKLLGFGVSPGAGGRGEQLAAAWLQRERGFTILVIEHKLNVVNRISDRVVVLDHGVKIAEGSFGQVATNDRVVEAYLGLKAATATK